MNRYTLREKPVSRWQPGPRGVDVLFVDGRGPDAACPTFTDVAAILDWRGKYPCLVVPLPLGARGVRAILALLDEYRVERGLEPVQHPRQTFDALRAALLEKRAADDALRHYGVPRPGRDDEYMRRADRCRKANRAIDALLES